MLNKNLHIRDFETLMLKDYTATKITIYFAYKTAEEGYDPYEQNLSTSNLNPKTIRGYIHPVTAQQLIYKQYGLSNIGAVEVLCDTKYIKWFKMASKIVIDSIDYKTLVVGNQESLATERAFKMGKIVLVRND